VYATHCVRGTREVELVRELASRPFARIIEIVHKHSLHTIVSTAMQQRLEQHSLFDTFIIIGMCNDMGTYDMALDLKLRANSHGIPCRVIMAANYVDTYDLYVPELNFLFVLANRDGTRALIALLRLREIFWGRREDNALFLARAVKEAVHELGHTYGLLHCRDRRCVMAFSNSLADTDYKGQEFCPTCRKKIQT
jgi:predicted Zn-dependent protease